MIAPFRPMLHVIVLGSLGLLANVAGAVSTSNEGPGYGPHWYPVTLIALALPPARLGE